MDEIVFLPFRPRKWPVCMDEIVSGRRRWTARAAQVTARVAQVRFFRGYLRRYKMIYF